MEYSRFLKIILTLQREDRVLQNLYKNRVDLIEFVNPYHEVITELVKEVYGEKGEEWFSWYCYESDFGQKDWSKGDSYRINGDGVMELEFKDGEVRFGAYDENGDPICYSHESLWKYLETLRQT